LGKWSNEVLKELNKKEQVMLYWAAIFMVIALVASILGASGAIVGTAANIAYVLFVVAVILFIVSLVVGRGPRTPVV
jgi:uncharacterized membrane protein YtjA (UPF0391 family)